MIPPGGLLRRIFLTVAAVGVLFSIPLLFLFDVVKINWRSNMEVQASFGPQEGPRRLPAADAVRFDGPSVPKDGQLPANPVPADAISLQRGRQLFVTHCAVCHGADGKGNGPVAQQWKADAKRPADLTAARLANQSDGALYLTISQGFGIMPPLNENLNVRERWDVVNYARTLSK
ncbi:MAG: c-type cytochrome [Chloroflexi bacterium]|nr:c-type cytochrome [Chloroflexota bacterium]